MAEPVPDVTNDGFWLDFFISELTASMNTPSEYDDSQVVYAMQSAVSHANRDLELLKTTILAVPYTDFAAYCNTITDIINDVAKPEFLYRHAVHCWSKLALLKMSPALGRSTKSEDASDKDEDMEAYLMSEYLWAIGFLTQFVMTDLAPDDVASVSIPSNVSSSVI